MLTPEASTRSHSNASPPPTVTTHDTEDCLTTFRAYNLRYFPCVLLPDSMTVDEIQQKFPYLWLNIRAICTRSTARQNELAVHARETFARKALIDGERSIDLLLGVLMQMSW